MYQTLKLILYLGRSSDRRPLRNVSQRIAVGETSRRWK